MNSFFDLSTIIQLVITITTLGGYALLVKHQRWGWGLLLFPLLWFFVEDVFADRSSGVLIFLNNFIWMRILTIGVILWGYYQWRNLKYSIQTSLSNNHNILDDLVEERSVLETYQLSKQTTQQTLVVAAVLFVSILIINMVLGAYAFEYYSLINTFFQAAFLLSFYLLAKRYVEGWLLFIMIFIAKSLLYGFSFHFYTIAKLAIYVWGYIEWKKVVATN